MTLEELKVAENMAFLQQKEAFGTLKRCERDEEMARRSMDEAWQKRADARERMNHEYDLRKYERESHNMIWRNYREIRDDNSRQISAIREESDIEHEGMVKCFNKANEARKNGDMSAGDAYEAEGRKHREVRNSLNRKAEDLIQEIRSAKEYAYANGQKADSWAFENARKTYMHLRAQHEKAREEYMQKKKERFQAEKTFNYWQKEHKRLKDEFLRRTVQKRKDD